MELRLTLQCVSAEDDLWDEIGEEIPAEWADEHAPSKHSGKPVQPGEYFTIVKGVAQSALLSEARL